ncbi:MAG TPA: methyltransferase domain-containing protein [Pseudonocardiaceae bacterium]|nr:methyltransferase domain-containing protein [Pseudonocardiaceae bacterium]
MRARTGKQVRQRQHDATCGRRRLLSVERSRYSEAAQWAAQAFEAAADHYDDPALGFWRRFGNKTVERLGLRSGQQVLDLCCGSGESALAAAHAVGPLGRVLAVDAAAPMLELAAAKATAAGLRNVEFRQADATCIGLPDRLFDAVICVFGVFFAEDMRTFTEEMWRMVAPGGMLAVTSWGPELFEPANREFWDAVKAEDPKLYQNINLWDEIITPHRLCELLTRGGVSDPQADSVSVQQRLTSPTDFWHIVCGSGYRVTVDALSVEARSRVRHRVLDRLRTNQITTVRTDVIYGIGVRPPLPRRASMI